ncbi:MAG: GxxExxY protein [Chitinophagaceae bacterium]|nr:GxxExxY protein [Chitinophagaceae bacterium]
MELLHKTEVYTIVGCCIEVWKILGYGFSEVVYKDAMEQEFLENDLPFKREEQLPVFYKSRVLKHRFNADFSLFDSIIVEVKASDEGINNQTVSQILNYIKAAGCKVGLIINFGKSRMEYKRLIM